MVGIDEPDGLRSIFRVLTYGLILNTEGKLKHKTTIRCNLTVLFELLPDWPFSQFIPQDGAKKSLFLERMNCCYSGDKASPTVFRFAQIGCLFSPGREWFCQTFLFLEYNAWNGDLLIYLFILPCCGCLIGPNWEMWGFFFPPGDWQHRRGFKDCRLGLQSAATAEVHHCWPALFCFNKSSFEPPLHHLLTSTGIEPKVQLMYHPVLWNSIHPYTIFTLKDLALEAELKLTYCLCSVGSSDLYLCLYHLHHTQKCGSQFSTCSLLSPTECLGSPSTPWHFQTCRYSKDWHFQV